jgi:hypothetical protein
MRISSHLRLFLPYVLRFRAYPNHMHIQIIVKKKQLVEEKEKEKNRKEKHNSTD